MEMLLICLAGGGGCSSVGILALVLPPPYPRGGWVWAHIAFNTGARVLMSAFVSWFDGGIREDTGWTGRGGVSLRAGQDCCYLPDGEGGFFTSKKG
jgi:hypothetical protein